MPNPWYELRLTTDMRAFVGELERFVGDYVNHQREERLIGSEVKRVERSFWDPRPIDRAGLPTDPAEALHLVVDLKHQSKIREWLTITTDVHINVSRLSDRELLVTFPIGDVDGLTFVRAFVARCEALFSAVPVSPPADAQNRTEQAIAAYYQRRGEGVTLKEIALEYGLSYDYLRKAKSQYDRKRKV